VADKIKIVVEQERLRKNMKVGDVVALEEGKVKGVRAMLALFMVDEQGKYLDPAKAEKRLDTLTVDQMLELAPQLLEAANSAVGADPLPESASTTSTGET